MKIQCENCGTQHELDPPSWVVSSGRAFRFRCSACGHSQSVQPDAAARDGGAFAAPTEVPAARVASPTNPTLSPPDEASAARAALARAPTAPPRQEARQAARQGTGPEPKRRPLDEGEIPSMPPPALIESLLPAPERGAAPDAEAPEPSAETLAAPSEEVHTGAVYLKQNGQIYMVRDWETLKRWIVERRVDENDLVSEGGVRWEPIGSHPGLEPLFATGPPSVTSSHAPLGPAPTPFPFGSDTPFSGGTTSDAPWTDDDTEGIPTGLPPLPTEDDSIYDGTAQALPPALPDEGPPPVQAARPAPTHSPQPVGAHDPDEEIIGEDPDAASLDAPYRASPALNLSPQTPLVARPTAHSFPPSLSLAPTLSPRVPSAPVTAPALPVTIVAAAVVDRGSEAWEDLLADTKGPETREAGPARETIDPSREAQPRDPVVASSPREPNSFDLEWSEQARSPARLVRVVFAVLSALIVVAATLLLVVFLVLPRFVRDPVPTAVPTLAAPVTDPIAPEPRVAPVPAAPVPAAPVAPAPVEPAPVAPAPVAPAPVAAAPVAPKPVAAAPTPAVAATPKPAAPASAPKPPPAPAPVKSPSVTALLAKAWQSADADPAGAQVLFDEALSKSPGHEEATYGKGYVLLLQGDNAGSTTYLCRVRNARDEDIRQDATGMIASHQLACP